MSCKNVTDFGVLKINKANICNLLGPFYGDTVPCPMLFDARDSSDWENNRILGTLNYNNGADHTLVFDEYFNNIQQPTEFNVTIKGVLTDPAGVGSQVASKQYVDDELEGVIHLHENVIQRVSTPVDTLPLTGFNYTGLTLEFIVTNAAPWSFVNNASVTYDGVTININDSTNRVLFTNTRQATNPSDSNGVYILTSVGAGGETVWTRTDDLDDPSELRKGELVVVDAGSNGTSADQGLAFKLQANVASLTSPQDWLLFHSSIIQQFAPILYDDGTSVNCRGSNALDNDRPVVGVGAGTGQAIISNDVGIVGTDFQIRAQNFNLNCTNTLQFISNGTGFTFNGENINLSDAGGAGSQITLEGDSSSESKFVALKHLGSKVPGGTVPGLLTTLTYTNVKDNGHFTAYTDSLPPGDGNPDSGRIGGGVLFDSNSVYGGANSNCNTFLLAPRSLDAVDQTDLSFFNFANGPSGLGNVLISFATL